MAEIASMSDKATEQDLLDESSVVEIKTPLFKRWWMIVIIVLVSIIVILGIVLWMFVIFAEYGQCSRSCRLQFCNSTDSLCFIRANITGERKKANKRDKCLCTAPHLFEGTVEINRFSSPTDTWALDNLTEEYCAIPPDENYSSGAITYGSEQEADAADAIKLHIGPCGQCSNVLDKEAYNKTRLTLTETSKSAAFKSILSRESAKKAMEETRLSDGCVECWIENMRHTLIHCFGRCMFGDRSSCGKNGELTDCLLCDEVHSGVLFRNCAGMTRRRAGIVTDICRKPGEIK